MAVAESGCWLWTSSRRTNGYGEMAAWGKNRLAHRVMYELLIGPIPDGLVLDHLCRTPACVNPDHLEAVTERENILRGSGAAAANARKTHCIHGHEFTEENTKRFRMPNGRLGRACRTCIRADDRARRARLKASHQ